MLEITADLSAALAWVLGDIPADPEPVVVVAACLDALAKGSGLSENGDVDEDPLERADLPALALELLRRLVADGDAEVTADGLRDRIYKVFDRLAEDPDVRRQLNKKQPLTDVGLLRLGQIYWNLEGTTDRARLPIRPAKITKTGRQVNADIPVPGHNKDFATLTWTARVNQKANGKSSGQGFRTQGARLAVLAARLLVAEAPVPLPGLGPAAIQREPADSGKGRGISAVRWPARPHVGTRRVVSTDGPASPAEAAVAISSDRPRQRVLLGSPAEAGADYQRRATDEEIEGFWADGGDRRIWLMGGPGLGKSYTARRFMQDALAHQGPDREELLVWVDSADADSVTEAFASAVDRLRQQGLAVPGGLLDAARHKAKVLLGLLAVTSWRWLIVLDNADADSLIGAGLIPPGGNPNGRVLLTTRIRDHRVSSHGRVVTARLFSPEEAEEYLRNDAHNVGPGRGPLAVASRADTSELASTVGYHPLALSVAASTIAAHAMAAANWIDEFTTAGAMDVAADEPDRGGYPHLIGATWRVALARASESLPEGVVERAATVAAIQDPDGHPTWLWDRDTVADWVAGGQTLARHHGIPVAVQRLIDSGIVELRGGTWNGGVLAIHQLAARAIREGAASGPLGDIAGIVLRQWLLELTSNPHGGPPAHLRRSLRPIAELADLPDPTRRAVTALLAYRQPTSTSETFAESVVPHLNQGGTTGRIAHARLLFKIADEQAALGQQGEAQATYAMAANAYRRLIDDDPLDADERARCLMRLGDTETQLGNPEQARTAWEQAADLLDRLVDTAEDTEKLKLLSDLLELFDHLGHQDRKDAALARAENLLLPSLQHSAAAIDPPDLTEEGGALRAMAHLLARAGRLEAAKQYLGHEAALYEQHPDWHQVTVRRWADSVQERALLHAQTGEWSEAERLLTLVTDIQQAPWLASLAEAFLGFVDSLASGSKRDALVLLASVQTRLGRSEEAEASLAQAADYYREPPSENEDPDVVPELPDDAPTDLRRLLEEQRRQLQAFELLGTGRFLSGLAEESSTRGRWADALELRRSALDLAQQAADADPGEPAVELSLAAQYMEIGLTFGQREAWDDAARHYANAADIVQMVTELDPDRIEYHQRFLAFVRERQAIYLGITGRPEAAADAMARSVSAHRRIVESAPQNADAAAVLAEALTDLARRHAALDELQETVSCLEESVSILSQLTAQAPEDDGIQTDLASTLALLGSVLMQQEQPEDAIEALRLARKIYLEMAARRPPDDTGTRAHAAWTFLLLGYALVQTDRLHEAVTHLSEAVAVYRPLAEAEPDDIQIQVNCAFALLALGESLAEVGDLETAVDHLTASANILQLLHDLDPSERPDLLIHALESLADSLRDIGRGSESDKARARVDHLEEQFPDNDDGDEP